MAKSYYCDFRDDLANLSHKVAVVAAYILLAGKLIAGASSKGPCESVADLGTTFLTVEMEGCRCVVDILHASHVRRVLDQKVLAT
jgi:hypothetical protein